MRTKLLTFLLMAGTVVGCASNPPPPAPMPVAAAAPAPAPAPMALGPFDGTYRGTPVLAEDAPKNCPKMNRSTTVRVMKNNSFTANGMKGTIGPDGNVSSPARARMGMTGTAGNGSLNLTTMRGKCTYNTVLNKA